MPEKRYFRRIQFANPMLLLLEEQVEAEILNLSLKGVRIRPYQPVALTPGLRVRLCLPLNEQITLELQAQAIREQEGSWSFEFVEMELEAFTHLRSLLEANLGDDEEIEQELRYWHKPPPPAPCP